MVHDAIPQFLQDFVKFESGVAGREGRDDDVRVGIDFSESFLFPVGDFDDLLVDESNIVDSDGIAL